MVNILWCYYMLYIVRMIAEVNSITLLGYHPP